MIPHEAFVRRQIGVRPQVIGNHPEPTGCATCVVRTRLPPTGMRAWPRSRQPPCFTLGPASPTRCNLHNARRAHTPIVNVVGDHATVTSNITRR